MQRNLVSGGQPAFPAALRGNVFATPRGSDNPQELFQQISATLADLGNRHNVNIGEVRDQVGNLTASMEAIQRQVEAGGGAIVAGNRLPPDPEYSRTFASYFRRGDGEEALRGANAAGERATIQAAMSIGTAGDGGYLAPVEWDRKISQALRSVSPMRRIANVQTTGVNAFSTLWNNESWGSGWVGETAARPQTSTTSLAPIIFATGEIFAMPATTQRLIDDAAIDIEQWLSDSIRSEFARQEGVAFLNGDGVNKPAGFLTYVTGGANAATHPGGVIETVTAAIGAETLIDFAFKLGAPYRQNATWVMSSLTAAVISKLKDDTGSFIWREGLVAGTPATLLGRPVEIDEGMPAPTAGNLAVAFADWRVGYLINDRIGLRILRDVYTAKPFCLFYATKRVGGGVLDPNAIKLLKIAA